MNLFALTPRAGSRNHVFLVPDSSQRTQRMVADLSSRVQEAIEAAEKKSSMGKTEVFTAAASDFIAVSRRVVQTTTGRLGYEWLCLAGLKCSALSQDDRQELENWLKERLDELEKILQAKVAADNWNRKADLFEVLPELADWQQEARRRFRGLQPASNPNTSTNPSDNGQLLSAPTAPPSKRIPTGIEGIGGVSLVAFALVLLLAFALVALACPDFHRVFSRLWGRSGQDLWCKYTKELLGQRASLGSPHRCKEQLANALGKLYSNIPHLEENIGTILQQFEKDMGRTGNEDIESLIKSGPPSELKKLFPNGQFDPLGLVDWTDKNFWEGLEPEHVRQLLHVVLKGKEAWKIPEKTREDYKGDQEKKWYPVFETLEKFCQSRHLKIDDPITRRFYLKEDETAVTSLKELLYDLVKIQTIRGTAGEPKPKAREYLRVVVDAIQQQTGDLEKLKNRYNPDDKVTGCIVRAAEALEALYAKWSDVSDKVEKQVNSSGQSP